VVKFSLKIILLPLVDFCRHCGWHGGEEERRSMSVLKINVLFQPVIEAYKLAHIP
jgi:hypothetical protein